LSAPGSTTTFIYCIVGNEVNVCPEAIIDKTQKTAPTVVHKTMMTLRSN
jgi:hypothetical protein